MAVSPVTKSKKNQTPVLPWMFDVPVKVDMRQTAVARDEGIAAAATGATPGFHADAMAAIRRAALMLPSFIVDDVWAYLGGRPAEARAMGPVMLEAVKLGVIEKTTEFRSSAQPQCHGNPRRVWRSKLYRP